MVLGFRYTHNRHRGSVLPRISVERAAGGVRVVAQPPTWKEAVGIGCLVLMLIGLLLVLIFVAHPSRQIGGVIPVFTVGLGILEMARRYFAKRKLRRATLLVRPWPLRIGERATLEFEKRIRARAASLSARLVCIEEAKASAGKYETVHTATRHEMPLDGGVIEEKAVRATWEIEIPPTALPSFSAKSNRIIWRIETLTKTDGLDVPAEFELLVIPEVVT